MISPLAAPLPPSPKVTKKVEQLLKSAGYSPGAIDGKLTETTKKALTEFQSAMGLDGLGTVTPQTIEALKQVHSTQRAHDDWEVRGEKNKNILELEKSLRRDGYATGKADGIFDGELAKAVKEFKQDHADLKHVAPGVIGAPATKALKADLAQLNHPPEHQRHTITAADKQIDRKTATAAQAGIGAGATGAEVKNIQRHLAAAGYPVGMRDGVYDAHVEASVRAMQKGAHLPITGSVDAATWKKLSQSLLSKDAPMTKGERSSSVLKAEKLFKKLGMKVGKVDGLFDAALQRASRKFERSHKGNGNDGAIGKGQLKAMAKALKDQNGINKKLVAFYGTAAGYKKVFNSVVNGWFGTTHNACVAFVTEALKHAGVKFPANGTAPWGNMRTFTTDMSNYLQKHEHWKKIGSAKELRPGDVVLTKPEGGLGFPAHTYMFQGWADKRSSVAWVVDNQGFKHKRNINQGGGGFNFTPFAYALRAR